MRFLRPPWLNHGGDKKDAEVYSCDVSPDGTRLATAAGDSHVRVWSVEAVNNATNASYSGPRQLASMSHHLGTIHAVRFSPNGRYLASGADDKLICVYVHDPNPPSHNSAFGTNEPPPVENWQLVRRLNQHDNDVQDLGWSYDCSILVSVGLDSKVIVWSGHTFDKLKTISNHQSHVKGITFDPANKYFATASDDRTIRIYRFTPPAPNSNPSDHLNNFVLEKTIGWASAGSPLTTYFRRCSWSPDGNLIAAANSVNGPVATVAIITRGSWDPPDQQAVHLVGHEAPVEVCAFSPRLFTKTPVNAEAVSRGEAHPPLVTVIACAGQDKTLTIWSTVDARPMVIAQDLCEKSFTDIAWHPDGKSLFATSLDGTIVLIRFGENELGYELPLEQNAQSLEKYGASRKGAGIVEGPTELLLEERSKQGDMKDVEDRMGALMGDRSMEPRQTVETMSTQQGAAQVEASQVNGMKALVTAADPAEPNKAEKLRSRVTITKDGKKRVAPLLVSSSNLGQSNLPQAALRTTSTAEQYTAGDATQSVLDLSRPVDALPRGGISALLLGNKRKLLVDEGDEDGQTEKRIALAARDGATPILRNTPQGLALPQPGKLTDHGLIPDFVRPAVVNPSLITSSIRLAVPKLRSRIFQRHKPSHKPKADRKSGHGTDDGGAGLMFEAQNPTGPSPTRRSTDREPARVLLMNGDTVRWFDYLPKSVLLLAHGDGFWVAACEDGSVHTWTMQGRRLLNALILESQPVILEARTSWLLCITAVGMCYVWNMHDLCSPHPPVSLAPVLDIASQFMLDHPRPTASITTARVTSEGRICVTTNNGDGYIYSPTMLVWQRISEPWWALGSQYWNTATEKSVGNVPSATNEGREDGGTSVGVMSYIEHQTTHEVFTRGRSAVLQRLIKTLLPMEGYENIEASISIAHLENRLAAALQLGARDDFRNYLIHYAKRIGAEGQKHKVEELLANLVNGIYDDHISSGVAGSERDLRSSRATVCGWPRLDLLKQLVLHLGKYRELSRVMLPYSRLASATDERNGEGRMRLD